MQAVTLTKGSLVKVFQKYLSTTFLKTRLKPLQKKKKKQKFPARHIYKSCYCDKMGDK